jgi:hypothetical protein
LGESYGDSGGVQKGKVSPSDLQAHAIGLRNANL